MNRRWINFGRYSSPPIGKGKILDCVETTEGLYLKLEVNGVVYEGTLPLIITEDEEE